MIDGEESFSSLSIEVVEWKKNYIK